MDHSLPEHARQSWVPRGPNSPLNRLFQVVRIKRECYINDLWELVGHETVSTNEEKRCELERAINWLLRRLVALDVVAFGEHMGMQIMADSFSTIKMPRTIIGVITKSPDKPTILVYGNLDVEEASVDDGWGTDPFVLTEIGPFLYGRGVSQDKGPLMCWLNAIQSYKDAGLRLPINVVFLIESMAHSGSLGLETVLQQRISFFREVSCVVMSTRRWLSSSRPGIVYGSRGLVYYHLEVECANRDLSSCEHSGTLFEALPDLFYLLSSLVDCELNILVDGVMKPYEIDQRIIRCADFNYREFSKNLDFFDMPNNFHRTTGLDRTWALPHLSIHGIEGANAEQDIRFIIPHKVIGKFSIALAPGQDAAEVTLALQQHLGDVWLARASPNKMALCEKFCIPSWTGKCDTPEYRAAARAMQQTYDLTPNFIRDGGAILAPSVLGQTLGKNVLVLPIAEFDSAAGPVNERLTTDNYIQGTMMLTAFMWEYAQLHSLESQVPEECVPTA